MVLAAYSKVQREIHLREMIGRLLCQAENIAHIFPQQKIIAFATIA